ncbi:hypothetical protein SAMN02910456_01092 [Ruminococcaceae bacterium YRB3002]|nr:hypothetical protein SAMN02910456_01092 [Ruminococcaceae bacterium YRB3002]
MGNLVKMDLRRLFHTPMFTVSMCVLAVLNIITSCGITIVTRALSSESEPSTTAISDIIMTPFAGGIFAVLMFASLINFSYADIANGYVKNLAGQLKHRSDLVVSKFIVLGIHNIIFLLAGVLSQFIAFGLLVVLKMGTITNEGRMFEAIATLVLKWMLCMAISSILVFITNGIRNKTFATIVGVVIGTGSLGLAYIGLNMALSKVLKTEDIDVSNIMPDSLMRTVNVGANTAVVNAILVSIICTAIFLGLTIKVFNTRDVK